MTTLREKIFNTISLRDWMALLITVAVAAALVFAYIRVRRHLKQRAGKALLEFSRQVGATSRVFKKFENQARTFYAFQPFQYLAALFKEDDRILVAAKKATEYGGWVMVNFTSNSHRGKQASYTAVSIKVNSMRLPEISLRRHLDTDSQSGYLPLNPMGLFPIYSRKLLRQSIPSSRIELEEKRFFRLHGRKQQYIAHHLSRYHIRGEENEVIEWVEFMDSDLMHQLRRFQVVGMEFKLNKILFIFALMLSAGQLRRQLDRVENLIQGLRRCYDKDGKNERLRRVDLARRQREAFFRIVYDA